MFLVNKQINSGAFNGPICNQMGDENFSTQSPETVKKCELRFDFKGFMQEILEKILFTNYFKSNRSEQSETTERLTSENIFLNNNKEE